MTWLRRLFCKHRNIVLVKTHSPPVSGRFAGIEGPALHVQAMLERMSHGQTTETHRMLGKEES